jgi:hypothetical protein
MNTKHAELVAELAALPDRELMEVISAALESRREEKTFVDGDFEKDRWCLALASFGRFRGRTDAEPYVRLVGLPAPEYEHVDWVHLAQDGKCPQCGVLVASVSKVACCPVCSAEVECT